MQHHWQYSSDTYWQAGQVKHHLQHRVPWLWQMVCGGNKRSEPKSEDGSQSLSVEELLHSSRHLFPICSHHPGLWGLVVPEKSKGAIDMVVQNFPSVKTKGNTNCPQVLLSHVPRVHVMMLLCTEYTSHLASSCWWRCVDRCWKLQMLLFSWV